MKPLRDRSIREKAAFAVASTGIVGLLAAGLSVFAWDVLTAQPRIVRSAVAAAELLRSHLGPALAFDDRAAAEEALMPLDDQPEILSVCVYNRKGNLFANTSHPSDERPCAATMQAIDSKREVQANAIEVTEAITAVDERLGTLVLRLERPTLGQRIVGFLPVLTFVMVALGAVTIWLSALLSRLIERPLVALTKSVASIGARHDYAGELPVAARDEVGQLTRAFNDMIAGVRQRGEAIEVALRARDEFLSIASHELRTPLTTLLLHVERLHQMAAAGGDVPAETILARARVLERQAERLERLVAGLLDVSRIMTGKLTLSPEDVDLAATARETIESLRNEVERSHSLIRLEADAPVHGQWDRLRVEQVATNLISNAVKYGQGQPIDVRIEALPGKARLTVRDHGLGIAPEHIDRIFGRFERAVSERHYGGLGLGLWIVRQIVDAMHGSVTVDSRPGEGSTFIVELPRLEQA